MIAIERDETVVKVTVEGGPLNTTYHFKYDCGNKYYADLLRRHLDKALDERIQAIRKEEYERGWNDHKRRQPKKDWFHSTLNRIF